MHPLNHIPMAWELERGCRPCAFVCDCCGHMQHRCGSGADMWVIKKRSFNGLYYYTSSCDYDRMLCSDCYGYEVQRHEPCPCREFWSNRGFEQKDRPETREVCHGRNGPCAWCYWYGSPCQHCFGDGMGSIRNRTNMTYSEFSEAWVKMGNEATMPSYETFQLHNGESPKRTYSQVLKGVVTTW